MDLNLIVAVSYNGVIGNRVKNSLPWVESYPEDMKHFRMMTAGGTVIMGSNTMNSIGRALPKRRNIVISRTPDKFNVAETGIETFSSLRASLDACKNDEKVWIIGGGQIYQEAIPLVRKLYITVIPETITAEDPQELIYFPFLNPANYEVKDKIDLSLEKQLCCYIYEQNTWEVPKEKSLL